MGSRGSKYNNKITVCRAGHKHRSGAEARQCDRLHLLERAGEISAPEQQPRFRLHAYGGEEVGTYVGDFAFFRDGKRVVQDVKGGPIPALSKWKIRHAEAEYHMVVEIVREV